MSKNYDRLQYTSDNESLNEILIDNGIDLTCSVDGNIYVTRDDASRIPALVERLAPAAVDEYCLEEVEAEYSVIVRNSGSGSWTYNYPTREMAIDEAQNLDAEDEDRSVRVLNKFGNCIWEN